MCDFKPGEEVICVDAHGADGALEKGRHYIILRIFLVENRAWSHKHKAWNVPGIYVQVRPDDGDGGWWQRRFRRPIVDEDMIEADQGELVRA